MVRFLSVNDNIRSRKANCQISIYWALVGNKIHTFKGFPMADNAIGWLFYECKSLVLADAGALASAAVFQVKTRSSAVKGKLSWNLTSFLIVTVHFNPSLLIV